MIDISASSANRHRIEASFERILHNCSADLKLRIQGVPFVVADDVTAPKIYSDSYNLFQRAYTEGFGAVKGNIISEGKRYHLVVLNFSQIELCNLTDAEIDGVFSHELGHIFNVNPTGEIPSIMKGHSVKDIEMWKKRNSRESETYADYFSKLTKTQYGLIGSMNKYLQSGECKNEDLFRERIEQLKTEEELMGSIMEMR